MIAGNKISRMLVFTFHFFKRVLAWMKVIISENDIIQCCVSVVPCYILTHV
jgi:hypothetical protein